MNLRIAAALLLLFSASRVMAAPTAAEDAGYSPRYRIIIERSPFGDVPKPGQGKDQPNWSQNLTLAGIVESNGLGGPVTALIEDKGTHKVYFKTQGEAIGDGQDAIKVMRINTEKPESVVLKKLLEEATLTFGKPAATGPQVPGMAPPPGVAAPNPQPQPGGPQPPQPSTARRIPFRRGN